MIRRPLLATVAIAAVVLAQLASLAHHAAVRHVRCAEHGELVEAPELAGAVSTSTSVVAALPGHCGADHCSLATGLRAHTAAVHAPTAVALVAAAASSALAPITAPHVSITYRLAPKTSPPAVA